MTRTPFTLFLGACLVGCGIGDAQLHLRSAVDAKQAELSACYAQALARNTNAAGDVQVWVHVESVEGRVHTLQFAQSAIQDEALQTCVRSVLTQVRLSVPPAADLQVAYVFRFTPQ
jgi:hypothetical protein